MAGLKSALHDFLEDIMHSTHRTAAMSAYSLVQTLLTPEKARSKSPLYERLLLEHGAAIGILGLTEAFSVLQKLTEIKQALHEQSQLLQSVPRHKDPAEAYAKISRAINLYRKRLNLSTKKAVQLLSHIPDMLHPFSPQLQPA